MIPLLDPPGDERGGPGRREVWALVAGALVVRLLKGALTPVIAEDGVVYIEQSGLFLDGRFAEALGAHYPPVYPALIAAARLVVDDPVVAGKGVSALFGALTVLPLAALGRELLATRALRGSLWLYLLSPFILAFSGDVLSESTFVFFSTTFLAACWRAGATRCPGAGALAGGAAALALLTRPEGLILIPFGAVAIPILSRGRRGATEGETSPSADGAEDRAPPPARSAVPAILLCAGISLVPLVGYSAYLQARTGRWQFTRKGGELLAGMWRYADRTGATIEGAGEVDFDAGVSLSQALAVIDQNRGLFARKYVHDLWDLVFKRVVQATHPVCFVPIFFGWFLPRRRSRAEWMLIGFLAWWLLSIAVHWGNARYLLPMAVPALLWGGVGIQGIAWVLTLGREPWTRWLARLTLIGGLIGMATRGGMPERLDKAGLRIVGEVIAAQAEDSPRVCSRWRRVAFYAGGEHVPLPWGVDAAGLLRYCAEEGAEYLVLRAGSRGEELRPELGPGLDRTVIELEDFIIISFR